MIYICSFCCHIYKTDKPNVCTFCHGIIGSLSNCLEIYSDKETEVIAEDYLRYSRSDDDSSCYKKHKNFKRIPVLRRAYEKAREVVR